MQTNTIGRSLTAGSAVVGLARNAEGSPLPWISELDPANATHSFFGFDLGDRFRVRGWAKILVKGFDAHLRCALP